jgi:hypothetical protein
MSEKNRYCEVLRIPVPRLERAKDSADANYYSLLIVALLERGEPITLEEAAKRFEEAGIAPIERALASLKRCKPGRPPIYREGESYALDPHHHEVDLWAFRLGLRPAKSPSLSIVRPNPRPLPALDTPLCLEHLDEAWRHGLPSNCSAQRVATCVLDAHGRAMRPEAVLAFVGARSPWSPLSQNSVKYWRRGAAIRVREDGLWELDREHDAVRSARQWIRDRIEMNRRWADMRPDPVIMLARQKNYERRREEQAAHLARMRRVLIHAFPIQAPEMVVLVDIEKHEITTLMRGTIPRVGEILNGYDILAAMDVRTILRSLGHDPGTRRLAELRPPQKTLQINRRGRVLRLTATLLVQGSCGISRPLAEEKLLHGYLRVGERTKLRRRLEADAKSLFALYQYGRLHGAVRVRWGFLDEMIAAPWSDPDELRLHGLKRQAYEGHVPLEVVVGSAPGWADPWSRAQLASVVKEEQGWRSWLVDEHGYAIHEADIQLARLAAEP